MKSKPASRAAFAQSASVTNSLVIGEFAIFIPCFLYGMVTATLAVVMPARS